MTFLRAAILFVTFLTGASGLIYQVVWQRYLTRVLGAETLATALVLAVFLSGLSLGYYLCGRWSVRVRSPLRGYAVLELVVGFWGLAFPHLYDAVVALTDGWSFAPVAGMVGQGFLLTVVLIGVPTMAMGGTVPLLTRGLAETLAGASRVHATLYAINTLGAFLGTLAASFFLIFRFGLVGGLLAAALINFLAAATFYLASKSPSYDRAPTGRAAGGGDGVGVAAEAAGDPVPVASRFPRPALYALGFLSGFYVMALENFFFRIGGIAFSTSQHIFAMIVAVFVLAIAVGSAWVGRRELSARSLPCNQFFILGYLVLLYPLLDAWTYYGHVLRVLFQPNLFGFFGYQLVLIGFHLVLLFLPVAAMGATLPMAFHELKRELHHVGDHSGRLLAFNGLGACLGSLIGGIVIYRWLDLGGAYFFCLTVVALSAALIAWPLGGRWRGLGAAGVAVAALLLVAKPGWQEERFGVGYFRTSGPLSGSFDGPSAFYRERFTDPIVMMKTGPDGTVAVRSETVDEIGRNGVFPNLYHNGRSESAVYGVDLRTTRLLAHVPMLFARDVSGVFIIGLGTGVTAAESLRHEAVERVAVAEISTSIAKVLPEFAVHTNAVHANPRLEIRHGDALRLLRRSGERWPVIISEPSNLYVSGVDQLFTHEFYQLVRSRLTDDGVFMQWLHGYGMDTEALALPVKALLAEFPNVYCFMNELDLLILATPQPLGAEDLARAHQRLGGQAAVAEALAEVDIKDLGSLLERLVPEFPMLSLPYVETWMETADHPRVAHYAYRHLFLGTHLRPFFRSLPQIPVAEPLRARYRDNWFSDNPVPILPLP